MATLLVEGGFPLAGTVRASGAKNAVLKLMAAALAGHGQFTLHGVPRIKDVFTMTAVLEALGVDVCFSGSALVLQVTHSQSDAPAELVQEMRASIQVMGPLLARTGRVRICMPGGCAIGDRPIDIHLENLERLGAQITQRRNVVEAKARRLKGAKLDLRYPSVGATENLMMAAVLAKGTTIISNAAREPEIKEVQDFLNAMGAKIHGAGTSTIQVEGVLELGSTDYQVIPDRIEAGTYVLAAAMAGGQLTIENVIPEHLAALTDVLGRCGVDICSDGTTMTVARTSSIGAADVRAQPYPGFATDLQPQYVSLMAVATGESRVFDEVYPLRFRHVSDLIRMGADITVADGYVTVRGVPKLHGCHVEATDLRAGAALVLAGLCARGCTVIRGVEHMERGYESLVEKLQSVGAQIRREP